MEYNVKNLESCFSVDKLISISYICYPKQFSVKDKIDDFYELVFVNSGSVKITDGQNSFVLNQGEAFVHGKNVVLSICSNDGFANLIKMRFDCNNIPSLTGRILMFNDTEKQLLNSLLVEAKLCFQDTFSQLSFEKMTLIDEPPFAWGQVIKNYSELLLISLYRNTNVIQKETVADDKRHITDNITNFLSKNMSSMLTLKSISDSVGYSVPYIKKVFNEVYGKGIIKFFYELKILEAKKYISDGNYTFTQIAEKLGFDSVQYFSRRFKSFTNMTPTQYKNSIKLMNVL